MAVECDLDQIIDRRAVEGSKWHHYVEDALPLWPADMDFRSPAPVVQALRERVEHGVFGYPSELPELRSVIVERLQNLYAWHVAPESLVFLPGVITGFNLAIRSVTSPGDGVLAQTPVYSPILHAPGNHSCVLDEMELTREPSGIYSVDYDRFAGVITDRTRIFVLCNPHNPTGKVYTTDELARLGRMLTSYSERYGEPIYLISDEPYSKIVYNGLTCPSIFDAYQESFLVTSFSKDLSIPGERIGYIAVHPLMKDKDIIMEGLILCNRVIGFVNAPALMQRLIPFLLEESVDAAIYQRKRDILCKGLEEAGYKFSVPGGAFYLFPESPIPDDVEFVRSLQEENILTVPGTGFGGPGHFRIAYCVDDGTIERALPGFARVMEKYR